MLYFITNFIIFFVNFQRSEMLNELKSLELSAPSLSLMTSISQTQTSGLRNALKQKVTMLQFFLNCILCNIQFKIN